MWVDEGKLTFQLPQTESSALVSAAGLQQHHATASETACS